MTTLITQNMLDSSVNFGSLELLGSYTASDDTSVDIGAGLDLDVTIDDTYDEYFLVITPTSGTNSLNTGALRMIVSTDGGVTFSNSLHSYAGQSFSSSTITYVYETGESSIEFCAAGNVVSYIEMRISNPAKSNINTCGDVMLHKVAASFNTEQRRFAHNQNAVVNAFRILRASGNLTNTIFTVLARRKL